MKKNKSLSGTGIIKFKRVRGGKIDTTINAAGLYVLVNSERTRTLKTLDVPYDKVIHTTPFKMGEKTITPRWLNTDEDNRIFRFDISISGEEVEIINIYLNRMKVSYWDVKN